MKAVMAAVLAKLALKDLKITETNRFCVHQGSRTGVGNFFGPRAVSKDFWALQATLFNK